jgi:hypothetical protein
MPTIININGYRVIIWPDDHALPHVHVFKGDGEAKISIGNNGEPPRLITIHNLLRPEIRHAWEIVAKNQAALLNEWRKIHGNDN